MPSTLQKLHSGAFTLDVPSLRVWRHCQSVICASWVKTFSLLASLLPERRWIESRLWQLSINTADFSILWHLQATSKQFFDRIFYILLCFVKYNVWLYDLLHHNNNKSTACLPGAYLWFLTKTILTFYCFSRTSLLHAVFIALLHHCVRCLPRSSKFVNLDLSLVNLACGLKFSCSTKFSNLSGRPLRANVMNIVSGMRSPT